MQNRYAHFIFIGEVYPFCAPSKMNLLKMQFLLGGNWVYPFAFKICLATIGVAFLSATTLVAALFYFIERGLIMEEQILVSSQRYNIGKGLRLFFIIMAIITLCGACASYNQTLEHAELLFENCDCFTSTFSGEVYKCYLHKHYTSPADYAKQATSAHGDAIIIIAGLGLICLLIYVWLRTYEIIVTDKRVYGKAAFGRRVDLPIDSVSAIGTMWLNGIAVSSSSGRVAFLMIKNRDKIHNCLSNLLIERQSKIAAPIAKVTQELPQSNADELKKYKELLDMGAITPEEFDAKKNQLLNL